MTQNRLKITLTDEQLARFRHAANELGLSIADYIRMRALEYRTPGTDPNATPPCTPDHHIQLETEHYRRGYDTCMSELVKQGRVKPKSG